MKLSIAILFIASLLFAHTAAAARTEVNLNPGWKFILADTPNADESTWQAIDLPHTWNNLDGEDGGKPYHRGAGWYRKHLATDAAWTGKTVYLWIGAANIDSAVFVNDKPVGTHSGGFGAFCFDITSALNPTGDNVIAMRVDNAKDKNVPPLDADFTFFGGLYRGAKLIVTDPVCISPLDDASPGVYAKQTDVSDTDATLTITTKVRNAGTTNAATTTRILLIDVRGKTAGTATVNQIVPANQTVDSVATIHVANPHLWAGRPDPYSYVLSVAVGDDLVTVPVGFRFFKIDPATGFYLNGKPYPLHGVSRHQDRLDKGWAVSIEDHKSDYANMMEMGCTAVRLAHYQHAPEFYDLCNRGGIVAWAEIPVVNHVTLSKEFDENASQQLRELIKQNFNDPAIVCWGLSNELQGGNKTEAEKNLLKHQIDLQTRLNAEAHALDPTRITTSASMHGPGNPVDNISDVIAFNRYNGWYNGKPTDWPAYLDKLHETYPNRAVGISEYGAGASIIQHEADVKQPKPSGKWHPEEWQTVVHENAWAAMKERPWIWCEFIWNLHDFAADPRNEGDAPGRNDKGMVTYDGKTKKDAFYFYKANWTTEPMVYITERRFTPRAVDDAPVKVYSNCGLVDLSLNGDSLGPIKGSDINVFLFKTVHLKKGENTLIATGSKDGKTTTDEIKIVYDPDAGKK